MTREAKQLVLVCPEDRFVQLDVDVQQDVVQVDDDVLLAVTNDDEEASFLFLWDCELGSNDQLLEAHELEHHSGSEPECGSRCGCVSIVSCKTLRGAFPTYIAFFGILTAPQASPPLIYLVRFPGDRTPLNCVRLIAEVI